MSTPDDDKGVSDGCRVADGLIGRWMTVEASRTYAAIHYTALARELREDRERRPSS